MKIALIGATGFVGSAILQEALHRESNLDRAAEPATQSTSFDLHPFSRTDVGLLLDAAYDGRRPP